MDIRFYWHARMNSRRKPTKTKKSLTPVGRRPTLCYAVGMKTLLVWMTTIIPAVETDGSLPVVQFLFVDGASLNPEKLEKLVRSVRPGHVEYCGDYEKAPIQYKRARPLGLHEFLTPHTFDSASCNLKDVLDIETFEMLKIEWSKNLDYTFIVEEIEKALRA